MVVLWVQLFRGLGACTNERTSEYHCHYH